MFSLSSARTLIHPVVATAQVASSFYDTGLQMVVKLRCSSNASSSPDEQQRAISDFYMTYTMISNLLPFLPAYLLARCGDRGRRKVPIAVPLVGYLLSRMLLLVVLLFDWPIQVMFGGAVVYGLCGGFSSYWAGVMALASVTSRRERRSLRIMAVELIYGLAGFVGSLVSGHLFQLYASGTKQGTILVALCVLLYLFCLVYVVLVLTPPETFEDCGRERREYPTKTWRRHLPAFNLTIGLLFLSAILYDVAVAGGMEMLISFVMKAPLSWDATQVGYGNAVGFVIFFTSFLGVWVFSKYAVDTTLVIIGMISFAAGIYFMAFVTATYMFYLARTLTVFALIPMPTIRSLLSKQVQASCCGRILLLLQLCFALASLVYSPIFTKVYQATLDWFPGFVFLLSSILTVLAIIPISVVGCRTARQESYESLEGN
ncbi:thymic stromal cotransporter homolog [Scleropages formosus]|uniref:Solute carrier family 46 member 2 n=1 Tax=Scleropages formosus TaxID=113540 RepID=A0A8C9QXV9_SCLFO|nr:thymic stromal cotransporter homolog [Scleropages formosus]